MRDRLERDTGVVCVILALGALVIWPSRPLIAGGVVGGGLLIGFACHAVKGLVAQIGVAEAGRGHIVKFFTRHAILAVAAYVMMARLRLDALGMLVGASSLLVAVALQLTRSTGPGAIDSGHER